MFLLLAFLADLKPVPLNERGDRPISLAFIFILASQRLFGWQYAVLTAAISVLIPQLVERRPASRVLFNTGVYVLAALASGIPSSFLPYDGTTRWQNVTSWTFIGGTAFVVVNFLLVSLAVSFFTGMKLRRLLADNIKHGGPAFLTMAFLTALAVVLWRVDPPLLVLLAGPLVALTLYQRSSLDTQIARRDAHTDSLTGLGNHRAYELGLADQVERSTADGTPLVLCFVDVDDFKVINDTHGHPIGDGVLQQLAGVFLERGPAGAYRFGGDEFAVMFKIEASQLPAALERLLDDVARTEFVGVDSVSISIGAATFSAGSSEEELGRQADAALYWSKRQGKNRYCVYDPSVVREPTAQELTKLAERRARLEAAAHLIRVVDAKDAYTGRHSQSVASLAQTIAIEYGLDAEQVGHVRLAGLLHDLGKVALPDSILKKPGPLTDQERELVRTHPELGYAILDGLDIHPVDAWILHHHEHWDGRGYPRGLKGLDIPVGSRIILVADAYDVMVSGRNYQSAKSPVDALAELRRKAGMQFDPTVVEALERALGLADHLDLEQGIGRREDMVA